MEGVSAEYFVYPLIPGLIDARGYFAQAAQEAGLRSIVNVCHRPEAVESRKAIRLAMTGFPSAYFFASQCTADASTYRCRRLYLFVSCQAAVGSQLLNSLRRRTNNCLA
jgi:hypothetical protein